MKNQMKLRPSVKAKWLAALRSGHYKQTQHSLREEDSFCCLGVLCNLHAEAHPAIAKTQTDPYTYMGQDYAPPEEVLEWAFGKSFKKWDGDDLVSLPTPVDDKHTLAEMNDNGFTFSQIADVIEEQF